MEEAGISFKCQEPIKVTYKNQVVGDFVPDLIVGDDLIVELKSVRTLTPKHETQVVNYLKATGIPTGLLTNFGEDTVEVKKKYRDRQAIFEGSGK